MTTEDVSQESGLWVNPEGSWSPPISLPFPREGGGSWNQVGSSLVLPTFFRLLCPGGTRPPEGPQTAVFEATERGVMAWRFV